LFCILLKLRTLARQSMERQPGPARNWLEEYCFLLVCYGIHVGKYVNYTPEQTLTSLISSHVAVGQLLYGRDGGAEGLRQAQTLAIQALNQDAFDHSSLPPPARLHAVLEFARVWTHAARPDRVGEIIQLLQAAKRRFPDHVELDALLGRALLQMFQLTRNVAWYRQARGVLVTHPENQFSEPLERAKAALVEGAVCCLRRERELPAWDEALPAGKLSRLSTVLR
jgi:hypothetical protein